MKTAIITGIGGQDGAYLAAYLLELDYRVYGLTRSMDTFQNFRLKYLDILDKVEIIETNVITKSSLIAVLEKIQPDEIYNLAAQSSVGLSFHLPFETIEFNILSVLAWLEAIAEVNPKIRFYQASSSEMFGNISRDKLPLKENLYFHPASPYGISKATAHWMVINYRESKNLFATNGILFNHESCLRGPSYVVKKIINHLTRIKLGLIHHELKIGNVEISRDWGYAPMYIDAMHKILQYEIAEDFLICSGNMMSLSQLIDLVCNQLDLERSQYLRSDPALFRPNELVEMYGDPSKAKKQLEWNYQLSNIDLVDRLIRDEINFIQWELTQQPKVETIR
ncbi:MAG: GDP-mannose 4,6-dehydratase [Saprospiraceae bacterium]